MKAKTAYSFNPNWVSPPGDTIADLLEERDWTQSELAESLDFTERQVSQMINGEVSIGKETAVKLANVLGSTAEFWLNREAQYQAHCQNFFKEHKIR
jgi:HTH-type transcriptional regulator/antitoxin HigA